MQAGNERALSLQCDIKPCLFLYKFKTLSLARYDTLTHIHSRCKCSLCLFIYFIPARCSDATHDTTPRRNLIPARPTSIYKMLLPISSICEAKLLPPCIYIRWTDGHLCINIRVQSRPTIRRVKCILLRQRRKRTSETIWELHRRAGHTKGKYYECHLSSLQSSGETQRHERTALGNAESSITATRQNLHSSRF